MTFQIFQIMNNYKSFSIIGGKKMRFTKFLNETSRSLDEDDIKDSILKRMKKMFYDVKTDIRVNDYDTYFGVRFTVYDDYEAKAYGGIASWKKWFKEDLGIDPKSVEGSKTRHLGSAGGFDYAMRVKK